jgi:hypothetical protein
MVETRELSLNVGAINVWKKAGDNQPLAGIPRRLKEGTMPCGGAWPVLSGGAGELQAGAVGVLVCLA